MNHNGEISGGGMPEATLDAVDLDFVEILGEDIDDEVLDTESCTDSIFEELALAELVQRVIGHGTINRETNALCAKILNHPEVHMHPEVLPLYATYNDGMRAHGDDTIKAGMWLYRPDRQGERKSDDKWAWDPEAPLALAFVAPSKKGGDPGKHRLNLHFGGREYFKGNVTYKYHAGGKGARMDCRFVARCYQRVLPVATDTCSGVPEDTSSDAAGGAASRAGGISEDASSGATESAVTDPQSLDTQVEAEVSGEESLSNRSSGGDAAEGGDPSSNEMLFEFLSALEQKDIKAKYKVVRKILSRSELMGVFSENFEESFDDPSLLGQKDRPREAVDDCMHDEHVKRGRFKEQRNLESSAEEIAESFKKLNIGSSDDGTVAVPPENFLNKCITMAILHLSAQLDEDATRRLKHALDGIQFTQKEDVYESDTISEVSADLYGDSQSMNSEDIYGESMSCISDDEALFGLYDCLDQHPGQIRRGIEGSVVVDANWWKKMTIRLETVESKGAANSANIGVLKEKGRKALNDLSGVQEKAVKAFNTPPLSMKKEDAKVAAGIAIGVAAVAGLAVGAALVANSSGNQGSKAASDREVQETDNLSSSSPVLKLKGGAFQPFMTKDQEERARMFALFKAVDPGKLATLDELFEKRARTNGFDRMWMSYKQKWGAAAVEKAFANVRKKKKEFYRAKMVALFAENQPSKLKEVDNLMAKHKGQYDQMFKRWVENKKFEAHAVTKAHSMATKEVGTFEVLFK